MRRTIATLVLLATGLAVSGCVVEPARPGPGYCYYHPYQCR
jgi:hypothetical protein